MKLRKTKFKKRNRVRNNHSRHLSYQSLEPRNLLASGIELISVAMNGGTGNNRSVNPHVSEDGRYVAFSSRAKDLIAENNSSSDILDLYLRDTLLGETTRVSNGYDGSPLDDDTAVLSMSDDGRFIVAASSATNLIPTDTNGFQDVFLFDLFEGTVERISNGLGGSESNGDSNSAFLTTNGQFVVFESVATNLTKSQTSGTEIFVYNVELGTISVASLNAAGGDSNGDSKRPTMTDDGRYVFFDSEATDLVANDTNNFADVFVADMTTGITSLVSVASDGTPTDGEATGPQISPDGQFLSFSSNGSNLVLNDTNGAYDTFQKNMQTGNVIRTSTDSAGNEAGGAGAFSFSFVRDQSRDGRLIAFDSLASNLVPNDNNQSTDVFVKNVVTGEIVRYSADENGNDANNASVGPQLTSNGRYLGFTSSATNLVDGTSDTNDNNDAFRVKLLDAPGIILERQLFYERSSFDTGNFLDAVSDKAFLRPGETATFENYSSYSRGINGLALSVDDFREAPTLATISDYFEFRVGNNNNVGSWTSAPTPTGIVYQADTNALGTDLVFLNWPDNAIENTWLQVTTLANDETRLTTPDVFYFGNSIGETGNEQDNARVNLVDVGLTRFNQTGLDSASIDNPYDFDRDGRVNLIDVAIARSSQSGFSPLQLISPPTTFASDRSFDDQSVAGTPKSIVAFFASANLRDLPDRLTAQDNHVGKFPSQDLYQLNQSLTLEGTGKIDEPQFDVGKSFLPSKSGAQNKLNLKFELDSAIEFNSLDSTFASLAVG